MNELPGWTDYTVMVGEPNARFLEESVGQPYKLRLINVGDGRAALDIEAVEFLLAQGDTAVASVRASYGELDIEIGGITFTLIPVRATRRPRGSVHHA